MENNRRNYSGGAIGIESYNCRNRFVAEYASGIVCDVVWIDPAFFADYGILSILFREKRQKKRQHVMSDAHSESFCHLHAWLYVSVVLICL